MTQVKTQSSDKAAHPGGAQGIRISGGVSAATKMKGHVNRLRPEGLAKQCTPMPASPGSYPGPNVGLEKPRRLPRTKAFLDLTELW